MIADFIYIGLGVFLGYIWCLNHQSDKERKTFEQVDEAVRKELDLNKNLVQSLKVDLARSKQQSVMLREELQQTRQKLVQFNSK